MSKLTNRVLIQIIFDSDITVTNSIHAKRLTEYLHQNSEEKLKQVKHLVSVFTNTFRGKYKKCHYLKWCSLQFKLPEGVVSLQEPEEASEEVDDDHFSEQNFDNNFETASEEEEAWDCRNSRNPSCYKLTSNWHR